MKRWFLLLVVMFSTLSCTTPRLVSATPELQSAWVGKTHADIVRAFGAPTRECSDGADGYILIYESFRTVYDTWLDGSMKDSREERSFKEFYIGSDGVCYDVRSNDTSLAGRRFDAGKTAWIAVWTGVLAVPVIAFLSVMPF